MADVWSALGGELKPSLDLVVTAPDLGHPQRAVRPAGPRGPGHRDRLDGRSGRTRRPARWAWRAGAAAARTAARGDRAARRGRQGRTRRRPAPGQRSPPAVSAAAGRAAPAADPIGRFRGVGADGPAVGRSVARVPLRPPRARRGPRPRRRRPSARGRPGPGRPLPRPVHLAMPRSTACSPRLAGRSVPDLAVSGISRDAGRVEQAADAAEAPGRDVRLRRLARRSGSSRYDVELLLIALAPDLDPRFERLYGYLHDDVSRRRASAGLALELCDPEGGLAAGAERARLGPLAPLVAGGLLLVEDTDRPFLTRSLRVPDRVTAHLLGDDTPDARRSRHSSRRPARPISATSRCSPARWVPASRSSTSASAPARPARRSPAPRWRASAARRWSSI